VKVTVIVPVRNEAPRVSGTLESILAQTRLPDEIVVADATSTDDTVKRVMSHANRGVPLRVVPNPSIFVGGGRNAATRAASHDLFVCMDVGNRAEPTWLEEMVRPFEEDEKLDLLGGIYHPEWEDRFTKVVAALFYTIDCVLPSMSEDEIRSLIPADFVPGGMCMAYRRSVWERVGGFCEWSRKGQDRLFGLRVRRIGGKVGFTLKAVVHHHMAKSFRALVDRHFHYELWAARQGLPAAQPSRITAFYGAALAGLFLAGAIGLPMWPVVAVVLLSLVFRAGKKLAVVSSRRSTRFDLPEKLLALPVLLTLDAAVFSGRLTGLADRLINWHWRRDTERYLETGVF